MEKVERNTISAARKSAGARIGELIDEVFATRKAFCEVSNISPKKLSDIVHGRKRIDAELVEVFSKFLNKDKDYFINLEKEFETERVVADSLNSFLLDEKTVRILVQSPDGTVFYIPLEAPLNDEAALKFAQALVKGGA
ncbi:MAG: hypothetical protein ABJM43_19040 [Paracoccaceae bacterium]